MRHLANRYRGDVIFTLAAYNAGPGTVRRHGGIPPFPETRNYIRKVLSYYVHSVLLPLLPPGRASSLADHAAAETPHERGKAGARAASGGGAGGS